MALGKVRQRPDRRILGEHLLEVCEPGHAFAPILVLATTEELPIAVPVVADVEDRGALHHFGAEEDQQVLVREVVGHSGNIHALRLTA